MDKLSWEANRLLGRLLFTRPDQRGQRIAKRARVRLERRLATNQIEKERLVHALRDGDEATFIAAVREANRPR